MCVCAFSSSYVEFHQEVHFETLIQLLLKFCLFQICPDLLTVLQFMENLLLSSVGQSIRLAVLT